MLRKRVDGGVGELEITSGPFSQSSTIYFCAEQGVTGWFCAQNMGLPQLQGSAGVGFWEKMMMMWGLGQVLGARSEEIRLRSCFCSLGLIAKSPLQEMQSAGFPGDGIFSLLSLLGCFIRQPLRLGFHCLNLGILRKV